MTIESESVVKVACPHCGELWAVKKGDWYTHCKTMNCKGEGEILLVPVAMGKKYVTYECEAKEGLLMDEDAQILKCWDCNREFAIASSISEFRNGQPVYDSVPMTHLMKRLMMEKERNGKEKAEKGKKCNSAVKVASFVCGELWAVLKDAWSSLGEDPTCKAEKVILAPAPKGKKYVLVECEGEEMWELLDEDDLTVKCNGCNREFAVDSEIVEFRCGQPIYGTVPMAHYVKRRLGEIQSLRDELKSGKKQGESGELKKDLERAKEDYENELKKLTHNFKNLEADFEMKLKTNEDTLEKRRTQAVGLFREVLNLKTLQHHKDSVLKNYVKIINMTAEKMEMTEKENDRLKKENEELQKTLKELKEGKKEEEEKEDGEDGWHDCGKDVFIASIEGNGCPEQYE